MNDRFRIAVAGALLASTVVVSGCGAIAAAGIVAGSMAAVDRRTIGAQTEDQGIELNAKSKINTSIEQAGGISVTSYNRKVLLTGQVVADKDKADAERIVAAVPNVRSVHNELQVTGRPSLSTSASDSAITTKVKSSLAGAQDLPANQVKVVTEMGTVYLMGLVTRREADRAAYLASRVSGVQKVVTVFELIAEEPTAPVHGSQPPQQPK